MPKMTKKRSTKGHRRLPVARVNRPVIAVVHLLSTGRQFVLYRR
jgi:hypothetical protein